MSAAFDPISAAAGGVLIGLAAVWLMLSVGRVAGISGIFANALMGSDRGWRLAFLAGLIGAPLVAALAGIKTATPAIPLETAGVAAAGLLVGFGTRIAGGCTSGHGVCGIARFSVRSIVATVVFMTTAIVTVAAGRFLGGT